MNVVRIEGSKAALLGLTDIPDLRLSAHSGIELANGNWAISAYASDGAIAAIQARGCIVTVVLTNAQVEQRQQIAMTQVGDDSSPA
jgi:hypothetical protein